MARGPIVAVGTGRADRPGRTVGTHGTDGADHTHMPLRALVTMGADRASWPGRTVRTRRTCGTDLALGAILTGFSGRAYGSG